MTILSEGSNPSPSATLSEEPKFRPRCVVLFCGEKSQIVPQLFCSVILISRTSPQFRSFGLSDLLGIGTRKLLYLGREKRNMLPIMRWQRCSWCLALLAVGAALFLASCANQEGVGPAEGELKDRPPGAASGY